MKATKKEPEVKAKKEAEAKAKKEAEGTAKKQAAAAAAKKPAVSDPSRRLLERRKKKSKTVKAKKDEEEVLSTRELFPYLGKKNVEQTVKQICSSNPKWASVVAYHNRISSHGIALELDTLLRHSGLFHLISAHKK